MAKIDWQLLNNGEILLEQINVEAQISKDFVIYQDEYGKHKINRIAKTYERVNKEEMMSISFEKKILVIKFDNHSFTFDIECNYKDDDKELVLEYTLGDDKKVIKITRREDL